MLGLGPYPGMVGFDRQTPDIGVVPDARERNADESLRRGSNDCLGLFAGAEGQPSRVIREPPWIRTDADPPRVRIVTNLRGEENLIAEPRLAVGERGGPAIL